MLIIRLLRQPSEEAIGELNRAFADIVGEKGIRPTEPTAREVSDGDELNLMRLAVNFNQTSFGRLRRLIDALNEF